MQWDSLLLILPCSVPGANSHLQKGVSWLRLCSRPVVYKGEYQMQLLHCVQDFENSTSVSL